MPSLRFAGTIYEDDSSTSSPSTDSTTTTSPTTSPSESSETTESPTSTESRSSSVGISSKLIYSRDVYEDDNGTISIVDTANVVPIGKDSARRLAEQVHESHERRLDVFSSLASWQRISKRIWPYTAIGRIRIVENGVEYLCTGSLVAPNVILTAGHCAINKDTGEILEEIYFQPDMIYEDTYEEYAIVGMYGYMDEESFLYYADRDWMFLYTRESVGTRYGWLSLYSSVPFVDDQVDVYVSGYASHSHCNYGYTLCEGEGTMTRLSSAEGSYTINTYGGSSGGPVTIRGDDGSVQIAGLHVKTITSSRVNVCILASEFYSHLETAKKKSFSEDSAAQYKVLGIVCLAHDNCDDDAYCANINGGRCYRCDGCGNVNNSVATFDGDDCPLKCSASTGSGSNLDQDTDCEITDAASSTSSSVCVGTDVCISETSCGASTSLSESADPTVYAYLQDGVYISTKYVDVFTVTQDEFDSFGEDANLLAQYRGYVAGVLNSTLTIVAFGSVQPVQDELDALVSAIEPTTSNDPTDGIVFLTLSFVAGSILIMLYARWRIIELLQD